jgi:hypothetical protein
VARPKISQNAFVVAAVSAPIVVMQSSQRRRLRDAASFSLSRIRSYVYEEFDETQ